MKFVFFRDCAKSQKCRQNPENSSILSHEKPTRVNRPVVFLIAEK